MLWCSTLLSLILEYNTAVSHTINKQPNGGAAKILIHLSRRLLALCLGADFTYRKVSNTRRTKSQNLNASRLIL